ncbi:DUF389 domain-containing protein [Saccharopolyspora indica]|uniref:DUF389 domain-containing protein n=1 Tax=Saccharopolyspora indica TaxID=1229659 RepID=UPI0022EB7926|nr:DUF389 domain-containing protein [Saccharopolyspora indica]MDA3644143.1 DUF389 domain-containing protein [Saccharopolyspora indica]
MSGKLLLTNRTRRSAFWVLLVLSAIISGAGVVADSAATVIGAMVVAPLMTPILGTAFAAVLAIRHHIITSIAVLLGGVAVVVAIGYVLGLLIPTMIVADTNSQVAGRVSPGLIDLVAALATGFVGAFALVRSDVSDTLPGVAIAISLVPPLSVLGLTLESGAFGQAIGALLLFTTNVAAIIATATVVLLAYRVRPVAEAAGHPVGKLGVRTYAAIAGFVVLVSVPLGIGSYHVVLQERIVLAAQPAVQRWADDQARQIVALSFKQGILRVTAAGPSPAADVDSLRRALDDVGLGEVPARLSLVFGTSQQVPVTVD